MRKIPALAATGAALAILAAPSMANAAATGGSFTGTSSNVAFSVNGQNMTCSNTTMNGATDSTVDAKVSSSSWGGCLYNNQNVVVTPNHTTPWELTHTSGATSGSSDTAVVGQVNKVNAHVNTLGGLCQFTVTGSASSTFNEVTQVLTVNETAANGGLTVSGTSIGCFGFFSNGQKANLSATFTVTTGGPINFS